MLKAGQVVMFQTERMPQPRRAVIQRVDTQRNRIWLDDGGWVVHSLLSSVCIEDPATGQRLNQETPMPEPTTTTATPPVPGVSTCKDCQQPTSTPKAKYCRTCIVRRQKAGRAAQLARARAAKPPAPALALAPPAPRTCADCGVSIADRSLAAKYCASCAQTRDKTAKLEYARRVRTAGKSAVQQPTAAPDAGPQPGPAPAVPTAPAAVELTPRPAAPALPDPKADPARHPITSGWSMQCTDAKLWAAEFCATAHRNPQVLDEDGMLGWFAAALMAGFDAGAEAAAGKLQAIEAERAAKTPAPPQSAAQFCATLDGEGVLTSLRRVAQLEADRLLRMVAALGGALETIQFGGSNAATLKTERCPGCGRLTPAGSICEQCRADRSG